MRVLLFSSIIFMGFQGCQAKPKNTVEAVECCDLLTDTFCLKPKTAKVTKGISAVDYNSYSLQLYDTGVAYHIIEGDDFLFGLEPLFVKQITPVSSLWKAVDASDEYLIRFDSGLAPKMVIFSAWRNHSSQHIDIDKLLSSILIRGQENYSELSTCPVKPTSHGS